MENGRSGWRRIREKLKFKSLGCCSGLWAYNNTDTSSAPLQQPEEEHDDQMMNLASALAAERHYRTATAAAVADSTRAPLMRLIKQEEEEEEEEEEGEENEWKCCVCLARYKAAAFIPCGHSFCRICARELLRRRTACPLCNRHFTDVLRIY